MGNITRRRLLSAASAGPLLAAPRRRRPNVVLFITDDQGYGDVSLHGNPHLKTPHMDSVGAAGVRFTQFQVCPVCSPTRSSLMTGRYNYRTGVVDTYLGRSMMYPDEVTVAEALRGAGYRTGLFGKWHLGDNYPMRAIDQGFEEALVLKGGGLGQPSDPPESKGSYFDPVLQRNGKPERVRGYCTGIFTDAALEFIERRRREPFFAYVATNAPHSPLQIEDRWVAPYRAAGVDENTAKVYGMVANIDFNLGRLLAKVKELELERDTIFIFMTDNGPAGRRYNAGMRDAKGTVYQGGIRVPFFVRWPAAVEPGATVDRVAAHIDVMPTLLEACGVDALPGAKLDGRSLLPLLRNPVAPWPDRTIYTQWHRGDEPELFRACAARSQKYKLVNGKELYDLEADPAETRDVSGANPEVVSRMRAGYEQWFRDVSSTRGYAPPRIYLGTPHENPVVLTRQDWRGGKAGRDTRLVGYWEVDVRTAGRYDVKVRIGAAEADGTVELRLNGARLMQEVKRGGTEAVFAAAGIAAGPGRLETVFRSGAATTGAQYVYVTRVG